MEPLQILYTFLIPFLLDHILFKIQPQQFLESTHTNFKLSLNEFYTTLLEENLQAAFEILEVGICFSTATDPETRIRFPALPEEKIVALERGPLSLVSTTEELLDRKVVAPV
jgi:hypothetical protein